MKKKKKKTERFLDIFFCLPVWAFLTTGNDRFPSPRHTWYPGTHAFVLEYFFLQKSASSKLICII